MPCEGVRELLDVYSDGELPPSDSARVARHLETCTACREALDDIKRLGRALAMEGRFPLPRDLNIRIGAALDAVDAETARGGRGTATERSQHMPSPRRSTIAQAASLLIACAISAGVAWWAAGRALDADRLERDVFNAHVRSLLQESPVQVASSEQHALRPWFAGRVDVAPPVKDLSNDGFELVGGRLDYVDGRRASVLVYRRRLHIINVFVWPATPDAGDRQASTVTRNGYNLVSLRRGGIAVWLASDLNVDELRQLAERLSAVEAQ